MNRKIVLAACAYAALSACGDGGGGGTNSAGSTPAPAPTPAPPPPPTNATLSDLKYNQSFTNDAGANTQRLGSDNYIVGSAKRTTGALTVSYNATSNSYTVSMNGNSQTFGPTDIQPGLPGDVYYKKDGTNLTLVKIPYTGEAATQYVGLGYWMSSKPGSDNLDFVAFTYGIDTPAASVPRTGTAVFTMDVFGIASFVGYEPRLFLGQGTFNADFAAGTYSAQSNVNETELFSDGAAGGSGIELLSGGTLSASNGTFSGKLRYNGGVGSATGQLAGRFYGPAAQELGASFSAEDGKGGVVTGSFTGQLDASAKPVNLTLTNIT